MIEFKVIGEDAATVAATIKQLADDFGVTTGEVVFERNGEHTLIGTAIAERLAYEESMA